MAQLGAEWKNLESVVDLPPTRRLGGLVILNICAISQGISLPPGGQWSLRAVCSAAALGDSQAIPGDRVCLHLNRKGQRHLWEKDYMHVRRW